MKLLLVKPKEKFEVVTLKKKHHYTDLKKLLEIESPLTCVERKIGEEYYDFWLDDEGLLKEERNLTGACMNAYEMLVGNLLIARHDEEGNTIGLTDEDIAFISKHLIECEDYLKYMNRDFVDIQYGEFGKIRVNKGGYFIPYEV